MIDPDIREKLAKTKPKSTEKKKVAWQVDGYEDGTVIATHPSGRVRVVGSNGATERLGWQVELAHPAEGWVPVWAPWLTMIEAMEWAEGLA